MNFSRFLDIQSWWEVPSIAYFCSLFRTAFNLLDFDIEELEEALLTDGSEESASSLLTELIVRLLNGCLGNHDVSAFNYQMYLRRLFRGKCQDTGSYNPFNTDIDFQFLPLRTKVEILYALCDFRLDADDVFDLFKNLEAESLRVEPLGWDDNGSAYWYFYGTRLYREDIIKKPKGKNKKKKNRDTKKRGWFYGEDWLDNEETDRVWQVVCFTQEDWTHLTEKFSKASSKVEKELYRSLSQNFLPEIPRLFQEKERLQRKRLLELAPRRTSSRVLQKIKQKEEEVKVTPHEIIKEEEEPKKASEEARESRAKRRNLLRTSKLSGDSSDYGNSDGEDSMPQRMSKNSKGREERSSNSSATDKGEPPPPPDPPVKSGRKTNNSLASATGQILIPDNDEPVNSTRKKLKTSQIFSQTEEDIQTDMYKVLEQLTAHEDAWPFMDPVEEEYAPNYYAVIRRPMDLHKMEERLDTGYYRDFAMFKSDFKLIVNNCRLYNGQDNEYTMMVDNLQSAFDRLTEKYMHRLSSSDEEIAVEYQIPTPSRKHKLKPSESPTRHKRKKRISHSDSGDPKSRSSDHVHEEEIEPVKEVKKSKQSHSGKEAKVKKKRKGHHRHSKHSKNHRKNSHKSEHSESSKSKHEKKHKHSKDKQSKKSKDKKKKSKRQAAITEVMKRSTSQESLESSYRSRSASPLPSIHTPTPSPTELDKSEPSDQLSDPDFFKDKYDKIKERRRNASGNKDAWESLFEYKQKSGEKHKHNLHHPEKDKNQKLRETIEKLKAKNENYKEGSMFNKLFTPGSNSGETKKPNSNPPKENSLKSKDEEEFSDEEFASNKGKTSTTKKTNKKNVAKNESASEALEQAVKDISKWLDDAPKNSTQSSPCDSPAQTISTEEHDNSRLDDEFPTSEKGSTIRKEQTRKRPSSKEPKVVKRREIQRTIDRLQPGKSKGNLLTNTKTTEKIEEAVPLGSLNKVRDVSKSDESSPKLSLGSVLPTVEFTLGNDHKFSKNEESKKEVPAVATSSLVVPEEKSEKTEEKPVKKTTEDSAVQCDKEVDLNEIEPLVTKPSQEKATPNLSAWFKAFGAPKSTPAATPAKKKVDESETEEKPPEKIVSNVENKVASPKPTINKFDSPPDPETPNPETGGDSPLPNPTATPRQRRTSTGSSISERSSFSQDLDSPRHQISHTSPLLRSPASPRTDDFQKISYPIINGTVRAGFYQDTASMKSSPEKSCSPREGPQSPYSPYSPHVYASNSGLGSATPNYFVDHNKSPLPTYSPNPPPYYDPTKVPVNKPHVHEDYTVLGPDHYPQGQYRNYSPAHSPYTHGHASNYSQPQHSPQPIGIPASPVSTPQPATLQPATLQPESKPMFPAKKRMYHEQELSSPKKPDAPEKSQISSIPKNDFQKLTVDDIATALSEKPEVAKLNNLRDQNKTEFTSLPQAEERVQFNDTDVVEEKKKEPTSNVSNLSIALASKDNVDMVNMGYMNPDNERKLANEAHEINYQGAHVAKTHINLQQKGYEVNSIAMNLGMNNQHQKNIPKAQAHMGSTNITPAHSNERCDLTLGQNTTHAHQYDGMSTAQTVSNFSLNDIELANKKLYSCATPTSTALDYGNWKVTNQMRKMEPLPSDYSSAFVGSSSEKLKADIAMSNAAAINYNKNMQQQYHNYNVPRTSVQRSQELQTNYQSELRIPNPRGLLKNDIGVESSLPSQSEHSQKSVDSASKTQKADKIVQNHPLVNSMAYKTAYSAHSSLPLEGLRNLPNIPQMLERYTNNERYLQNFATSSSSLYHDKAFQMAQMFNKSMATMADLATSTSISYSQPTTAHSTTKDSHNLYKTPSPNLASSQPETKSKSKRKRTAESKQHQQQISGSQVYSTTGNDTHSSVKSSMVPGSAFNFGASANMGLGGSIYGDNSAFSIDDFRNSTNQLMAANYMVAVAHQQQQRNNAEVPTEKLAKPAHQNSTHTSGSFPFIGHGQVGSSYAFGVGADTSSPLYQQYLQRQQEELLRQTGAQIMRFYPQGYPGSLGVRQPYDSINRPSWL